MENNFEEDLDDSFEHATMKPEFTLELFEENILNVNVLVFSKPTIEIGEFKDTQIKTKGNKYVYKCKLFGYTGNKHDDNSFFITFELMLDLPGLNFSMSEEIEPLVMKEKNTGYYIIKFTAS